jgi:protoheme IX farnesyltransferase
MKVHLHTIKNYILVAKPGIVLGNLVTAGGGFFLASKGCFDAGVLQSTLIGVSLVVACGCILNNWVDRNLDRKMTRTRNRALAKGLMSPTAAVIYASMLGIAGTALLGAATNTLCTAIVLSGLGIYVGVYSLCLKRRSVYSTIIGSLAGAAPPLAGYCAVTNRFDLGALILLSIFCLWQIPHSYAIAVLRFEDYTAAAVPVLPVKRSPAVAKKHIVGYILVFMAAAPMLTIGGYTGNGFLATVLTVGLAWLYLAWSGYKAADNRLWAKRLFVFSILGITVLCVMMAIDFTMPASPALFLTCAP